MGGPHKSHAGFTLVEILIVVVILGILAAIVIPNFASATNQSRINSLKANLFNIRQQIQLYKQQHNDWPTSAQTFKQQLVSPTNARGMTVDEQAGAAVGPYLQKVPANPMNGSNRITTDKDPGDSGWDYDPETGKFRANDSKASQKY